MVQDSYDVLIMGGGNAGMGVTVPTRAAGLKVALVEERDLGGTCPIAVARRRKWWLLPRIRCTRSSRHMSIASP